jgi:hypothetical protein
MIAERTSPDDRTWTKVRASYGPAPHQPVAGSGRPPAREKG